MPHRKMRILSVLASPAPGGAEMLVRNLAAAFVDRGHACHILFMSSAEGVGNPPGFEGEYLAALGSAGVTFEVMEEGGFGNALAGSKQLKRAAAAFRPDLVHVHLARGLLALSLSRLGLPAVYTHHNVTTNFPPLMFRWFDRSVDRYVAISGPCEALLQRHVRRPISFIPNGVPESFARSAARDALPADPLILAVGNLTAQKDYPTLLRAAASVLARTGSSGRRLRFAAAGEGPERPALERLIRELGLEGRFELLGARADVAELMQQASALGNSSIFEGLPVSLIEAAMSGLPIVATNVGGNAEVVLDGETGFVVPPGRADLLADRLIELLSDEPRYVRFSESAVRHSKRFGLSQCVESHLDLYESILAERRN
jgi:glycosyltransferase involved in cell wall biosynthesis